MANLSDFKVGDVLLTYGLDMACHKCVVKTKIVDSNERGIVTYSDGCRLLVRWEDVPNFNDYFLYTPEKEMEMRKICKKAYNDWVKACKKQLEDAHKFHTERNAKLKNLIKEKGYFDGTHTIFELSEENTFFRWKKYDVLHINEDLNLFGMANDGDTMYLNLDELCVPDQYKIIDELEEAA